MTPVGEEWVRASRDYVDAVVDRLGLAEHVRDMLSSTTRELRVEVPVRMDDGTRRSYTGYPASTPTYGPVHGRGAFDGFGARPNALSDRPPGEASHAAWGHGGVTGSDLANPA